MVFIRHWRTEDSLFVMHNSLANLWSPVTILYLDVEHLSKCSPVTLYLSPATRIL